MGRLFRRFGLQARVSITFALGALLVTTLLAVVTLAVTRSVLVSQREDAALQVALVNGNRVARSLTPGTDIGTILDGLARTEGSRTLLRVGPNTDGSDPSTFGPNDIPANIVNAARDGIAIRQRIDLGGEPTLIIGLPIPGIEEEAQYYEAVSLAETASTMNTLSITLISAAAGTSLLAAFLGYWTSRRTLAPLSTFSVAAEALAGGHLDTRLDPQADRDLEALANSFNDMAGALEERIERDARFASEVSHELRSPLMTLTASMEVLNNNRHELSDRAATALDLLNEDLERFKQLVEDLLEISRFDVGTASLQLEEILVGEFVRQAVRIVTNERIPVITDDDAEQIIIRADKRRLAQVVSNLVSNAAKYGGSATHIQVTGVPLGVQISVVDAGAGVPSDERLVIFDRFSRGSASGSRGVDTGVGLGLALVAEHVNLHRGRVWVEPSSATESGATFVVELPFDPEEAL